MAGYNRENPEVLKVLNGPQSGIEEISSLKKAKTYGKG